MRGLFMFLAILAFQVLVTAALHSLATWLGRAREVAAARQIRLTDAIAWELGAIAAPVVRRRLLGRWQVRVGVPVDRPATVGRLVAIVHRVLAEESPRRARYELILTPQTPAA